MSRKKLENTGVETRGKTRGKTRVEILGYIRTDAGITIPELAKRIGITEKGIEYHMNKLKEEGIVDRIGPANRGIWVVIEK